MAQCVELSGDDLSFYSNGIKLVGKKMSSTYQQNVFKRYHSHKHFSDYITHGMAAKASRHRYGAKLRHCHHPM